MRISRRRLRHGCSAGGLALRELRGDQTVGDGPVEVATRLQDFNILNMMGPNKEPVSVPAQSLVAFTAQSFREVTQEQQVVVESDDPTDEGHRETETIGVDVWEFRVQTPEGTFARMFLDGSDILFVRAPSKVA